MSKADFVMPHEAGIKFLEAFEPKGPWVLTAVPPHRKGIQTRTFYPHSIPSLRKWLALRNRSANFHVNRPNRNLDEKAEHKPKNHRCRCQI
jgi:hypothetical protein